MSLINEALKRAQQERKLNPSARSLPFREKSKNTDFKAFLTIFVGGTALALALIAVAILFLNTHKPAPISQVRPMPRKQVPAPVVQVIPVETPVVAAAPEPKPVEIKPIPSAEQIKEGKRLVDQFVTAVDTMFAPKGSEAAVLPKPDIDSFVQSVTSPVRAPKTEVMAQNVSPEDAFIRKMRVTGVKFSGDGSKVLMNNQIFSIDNIVSTELGLTLTEIKPHELVLTNESGTKYRKFF